MNRLRRLYQQLFGKDGVARQPPPPVPDARYYNEHVQEMLRQQEEYLNQTLRIKTPEHYQDSWLGLIRLYHPAVDTVVLPRGRSKRWPSYARTLAYNQATGISNQLEPFRRSHLLLLHTLNKPQAAVFSRLGYFWIEGRYGHYRVGPGEVELFARRKMPAQIHSRYRDARRVSFCVYSMQLRKAHLIYDDMLAKLLLISANEPHFLTIANVMDNDDNQHEYAEWKRIERNVLSKRA